MTLKEENSIEIANQAIKYVKGNPCCICSQKSFCKVKYKGTCKVYIALKCKLMKTPEY
jgi:hypothetical protein